MPIPLAQCIVNIFTNAPQTRLFKSKSCYFITVLCVIICSPVYADTMKYLNVNIPTALFDDPKSAAQNYASGWGDTITTGCGMDYNLARFFFKATGPSIVGELCSYDARASCMKPDGSRYGFFVRGGNSLSCNCNAGERWDTLSNRCVPGPRNAGNQCLVLRGNPLNIATGNKYQAETDYSRADGGLNLTRYYNSQKSAIVPYGSSTALADYWGWNWRSNYDNKIFFNNAAQTSVTVLRPDGKSYDFTGNSPGLWPANDADVTSKLTQLPSNSGWKYVSAENESIEIYNSAGVLTSITARSGLNQNLAYSSTTVNDYVLDGAGNPTSTPLPFGLLIRVTDSFGRTLNFGYDSNSRVVKVTDPNSAVYRYAYDANNNLASITFPPTPTYPSGATRQYIYNELINTSNTDYFYPHVLTGIVDENNNRFATFKYDSQGRAISSQHAGGTEQIALTYNGDGTTTVADALGTNNTYSFQTVLGVVKATGMTQPCSSCGGNAANATTYDLVNGNVLSRTDFNLNKTTYLYQDPLGRADLETSRTEGLTSAGLTTPQTRTITTTWDTNFRLPKQINEPGKQTVFGYDSGGNLTSKTITDTAISKSRTWSYTYNALGQVLTAVGPRTDVNDTTIYIYYDSVSTATGNAYRIGDLKKITNALTQDTLITNYDLNGRPLTITDPNGVVTQLEYWPRGWLKSRKVNGVQTTQYDYDGVGQLTKVTMPDNSALKYTYDTAHRLTDIEEGYVVGGALTLTGNKIHYTLDAMGNRTQEDTKDSSNTIRKTHTRVFDALNRLYRDIGGTSPSTQITQYGYDNNGNQKTITDPNGIVTQNSFDALNRLWTITTDLNNASLTSHGVITNTYNGLDQLTAVQDPRGVTTNYTIDALGNVTLSQSPDAGNTIAVPDAAGNITQKTDARGIVSNYTYDALNRLTGITYPASSADNVTFYYDDSSTTNYRIGRLNYVYNNSGFISFIYDAYGNTVSRSDLTSLLWATSSYQYDSANRINQITYPSGRIVIYTRNTLGQITQVQTKDDASAALQTIVSSASYEPFGPLKSLTFGNAVTTTIAHDADYRISRITTTSTPNWDYVYGYDAADNITTQTDQIGSVNKIYGYDNLHRIITDSNEYGPWGYQYDSGSNRTQWGIASYVSTQTYPTTSNRMSLYNGVAVATDAVGNITSGNSLVRAYNNANQMSQANYTGAAVTSYLYNGLGQRHAKQGTATIHYDYGLDGKYLAQVQLNANSTYNIGTDYIWLDDVPIAQIKTTYGTNNAVSTRRLTYIHADHLNTPRLMTDSSKKVVWKWGSDAYGIASPVTDPDGDSLNDLLDLRFPGQIADAESGLFYNNARYYDPLTGRYTQSDPIGLQGGLNTYAYVRSNPISFTDPSGLLRRGTGLTESGWKRVQAAEQKIRDEIAKGSKDSNCPEGSCIPPFARQMILSALDTTTVNAARALQLDGADLCGVTTLRGKALTLAEDAFKNPLCNCLASSLYHELLHDVGIDEHQDQMLEKKCVGNLCK
jgi:RHS repeat-associated protein